MGDNDDAESIRTIHAAPGSGDQLDRHGPGLWLQAQREEVVGKAVGPPPRGDLSTKCGLQWYDDGGEYHFTLGTDTRCTGICAPRPSAGIWS